MDELSSNSNKKRVRDDSNESDLDSPEVKRLRDDLLNNIDDPVSDQTTQDLDSVMKSFADEISPCSASSVPEPEPVIDLTSESGESQPVLGYLLEASDDELGLPPPSTVTESPGEEKLRNDENTELFQVSPDVSGIGDVWGFEDQIPSYDPFELGFEENFNNEFVVFDGLYEYSDVCFDSSEFSRRQGGLEAE